MRGQAHPGLPFLCLENLKMAATAAATKKKTGSKAKSKPAPTPAGEVQSQVIAPELEKIPEVKDAPATDTVEKNPLLDRPLDPKAKSINVARVSLLEQARNTWLVNVDMNTTPEQCLDGSFWEHVAKLMQPGDNIHILPDDMSWEQVLHVCGQEPLFLHVVQKSFYKLVPATAPTIIPSRYKVQFAGAHHKWRVLRDDKPLKDGFATADLARRYAANHQAAVAR